MRLSHCQSSQICLDHPRVAVAWASEENDFSCETAYDRQRVSRLVREAIVRSGAFCGSAEASLQAVVEPGAAVLIKPNWVVDDRRAGNRTDCIVTHSTFILAALEVVLQARPSRVVIGDAPIQRCCWDALVTQEFRQEADRLAKAAGVDLEIIDFRRTTTVARDLSHGVKTEVREETRYCLFDLGVDSLLESVSAGGRFRITCYDPRSLRESHRPGRHRYLICREVFDADVVISLPKLKTHRKVGLTGALKNLVGINGNKDFLPHHRVGGTATGGDCYPGWSLRKRWVEFCLDMANRRIGSRSYQFWLRRAQRHWGRAARLADGGLEGGWHGNDTCWRMVLDLNRILLYGQADGTMSETRQRSVYTLTDAIVCGEGEGPLEASPLPVGAVTFSDSAPAADMVHAALLGFDYRRIPLIRESTGEFRWPLTTTSNEPSIHWNGQVMTLDLFSQHVRIGAKPPVGWEDHIEKV